VKQGEPAQGRERSGKPAELQDGQKDKALKRGQRNGIAAKKKCFLEKRKTPRRPTGFH